ncbi:MAG TPA: TonB-dependent siderophore receptor [Woeseiaceae bacterium]|nr:TonB-dependent siderophore receptor [Woeseiaceae bacterium]
MKFQTVAVLSASVTVHVTTGFGSSPALAQESRVPDDPQAVDEIVVVGEGSQVELTAPYAGGQVARGGRAGLLGNLDYMDAPFSGMAYTEALIAAQQADSVGDVLQNDPVVRVAKGFGNFQEVYVLRGFPAYSDDLTLNGVYGILPRQFVAAELLERVEVFRGANAFINGAAPGGSGVGGTINLVPKRAPAEGVRRVLAGFENDGQARFAADVGDRFAGDNWGVRFNAAWRDGESSVSGQDRSLSVFALGTDYAAGSLRFTADIGYQDNRIDAPRPQVTPIGEIPATPDADTNYAQPWTYTDEAQLFGVLRGEIDLGAAVTAWIAAGARSGEEANVLANPNAQADGTLTAYRFDNTREDEVFSADGGLRADFGTAAVDQRLILSASILDSESRNAYAFSDFFSPFTSDLYAPVVAAPPTPDFFTGGVLSNPLRTESVENSSIAIADTLYFLDDSVLATFGVRWQSIETTSYDYNTGARLSGYDDSAVTPVFGLVWKVSGSVSLYGNYAESLQPGAIAPATSGGSPVLNAGEVLEPFAGEQMEVGAKFDGGELGGTLSLFSLSRPNAIIADQVFQASGEQDNQGVEITVFGEPAAGIRLIGGATWLDAELARTQDGLNEGNAVIGVPEIQANVAFEWAVASLPGLTVDGRLVYTGEQYVTEANTVELDDWTRLDVGVGYVTAIGGLPLALRARVDNVTDESYWASTGGYPGANYLIQGNPRTFAVTASVDF